MSGISVIAGFDVNAPAPADLKMRVNTFAELTGLNANKRWRGMKVYVLNVEDDFEDEGWYQLTGNNNPDPIHNDNWEPEGNGDVSTNGKYLEYSGASFPENDGTPEAGPILQGYQFHVASSSLWQVGTILTARIDNPTHSDHWLIAQGNFGYTPLNAALRTNEMDTWSDNLHIPNMTLFKNQLAQKADLVDNKIPAHQLPSFVDDVINLIAVTDEPLDPSEYSEGEMYFSKEQAALVRVVSGEWVLIGEPESGVIYIAIDTNITYRWSGSALVVIGSDLALGETAFSAYRGDRGALAYSHSQATGNPHATTFNDIDPVAKAKVDNLPANTNNELSKKADNTTAVGIETPLALSGSVTINGLVCSRLIVDFANRIESCFEISSNNTAVGIDFSNLQNGCKGILAIHRSTDVVMNVRFVQTVQLVNDVQLINGGQNSLAIAGIVGTKAALIQFYKTKGVVTISLSE